MAKPPSKFEQMIVNNGPVQESIIQNLTRWEFRNLQLAGVRIPVNAEFLKKHQVHDRCHEYISYEPDKRCPNTTESVGESGIRACAGQPLVGWGKDLQCLGAETIKFCCSDPNNPLLGNLYGQNIEKNPIHFKVCTHCQGSSRFSEWYVYMTSIEMFRRTLCKRHSLEHTNQLPLNSCRCYAFMTDNWQCSACYSRTKGCLYRRAERFPFNRYQWSVAIPWSQPWAYLRSLRWACAIRCHRILVYLRKCAQKFPLTQYLSRVLPQSPRWMYLRDPWMYLCNLCPRSSLLTMEHHPDMRCCPFTDCFEPSWDDETSSERMQICGGCNAIIRI